MEKNYNTYIIYSYNEDQLILTESRTSLKSNHRNFPQLLFGYVAELIRKIGIGKACLLNHTQI